jgi:transcriptional regulator with XRE-family HTH domain
MTKTPSANIRAEMARAGVTQTQLAVALGLPQAAISRRLCDETPWRVGEIQAVAKTLGVPLSALLTDASTVTDQVAS